MPTTDGAGDPQIGQEQLHLGGSGQEQLHLGAGDPQSVQEQLHLGGSGQEQLLQGAAARLPQRTRDLSVFVLHPTGVFLRVSFLFSLFSFQPVYNCTRVLHVL